MTKSEAIKQLMMDGMNHDEAMQSFKEQCEYFMRGHDDTPLSYAEKLVIADIEELVEMRELADQEDEQEMPKDDDTLVFVKRIINVDVDGLKSLNHYKVQDQFDKIDDGFADVVFKTVDEFDYTWDEIERDGGLASVKRDLIETYGVVEFQ